MTDGASAAGADEVSGDLFDVVVNHEEQYSIWPADQPVPAGWTPVGFRGPRSDALDHIETVWTDITPLSVRRSDASH